MKNKYTVVTKSTEFNIVEVQKVEAKNPEEAYKVAVKQIIDQMICDAGKMSKSDKQDVIDNEELICVLEGHCKCVMNGGCE
jgi:hypothetical protein